MADDRVELGVAELRHHRRAVARVALDQGELRVGEPAGLGQDRPRHVDLADVVHERRGADPAHLLARQPHLRARSARRGGPRAGCGRACRGRAPPAARSCAAAARRRPRAGRRARRSAPGRRARAAARRARGATQPHSSRSRRRGRSTARSRVQSAASSARQGDGQGHGREHVQRHGRRRCGPGRAAARRAAAPAVTASVTASDERQVAAQPHTAGARRPRLVATCTCVRPARAAPEGARPRAVYSASALRSGRAPGAGPRPGPRRPRCRTRAAPGRRARRRPSPRPTGGSSPAAPRSATPRRRATRPARRSRWRRRCAVGVAGGGTSTMPPNPGQRTSSTPSAAAQELAHRPPVLGVGGHAQVQRAQAAVDEEAVEGARHGARPRSGRSAPARAGRLAARRRRRRPRPSGRRGTWSPSAPPRRRPARAGAGRPAWRTCCPPRRARRPRAPPRPRCPRR